MGQDTLESLHDELLKRKKELFEKVDADVANEILQSIRKLLSKYNLSSEQTEAILNYFFWFHYKNDN